MEVCKPPDNTFSLAAMCRTNFEVVCGILSAHPKYHSVVAHKKQIDRYRQIGLKLSNGRLACLTKYDSNERFEIGLQPIGNTKRDLRKFLRRDLDEILEYLNISESEVNSSLVPWVKWLTGR